MIGGIGMPELIVILVIVLIIFGAGKLPEIGAGLGKGIRNFKKAVQEPVDDSSTKVGNFQATSTIDDGKEPKNG